MVVVSTTTSLLCLKDLPTTAWTTTFLHLGASNQQHFAIIVLLEGGATGANDAEFLSITRPTVEIFLVHIEAGRLQHLATNVAFEAHGMEFSPLAIFGLIGIHGLLALGTIFPNGSLEILTLWHLDCVFAAGGL